jgi:hypothetical protein
LNNHDRQAHLRLLVERLHAAGMARTAVYDEAVLQNAAAADPLPLDVVLPLIAAAVGPAPRRAPTPPWLMAERDSRWRRLQRSLRRQARHRRPHPANAIAPTFGEQLRRVHDPEVEAMSEAEWRRLVGTILTQPDWGQALIQALRQAEEGGQS